MKKALVIFVVMFVVAIGSAVIWLLTLEGSYDVKRSITINKSNTEVFYLVQDFNKWTVWSPWLCMEPDAKVNITGSGMSIHDQYTWSGELVGEGTITHAKIVQGKSIAQDITFKAPMESSSQVYWEFNPVNDSSTKVTWGMKGEMPFFVRFMTKMMDPMIGIDYERGLKMLKELAEKGYVASRVEIVGTVDAPAIKYIGESVSCSMDEVGIHMKATFDRLSSFAADNSIRYEKALSIYHDIDFVKGVVEYTAALSVEEAMDVNNPFYVADIPASKALKIRFTGDYENLGNAWATGMSYIRKYKLKENKSMAAYEVYLNSPMEEPDPRKWVTEVYMPVK